MRIRWANLIGFGLLIFTVVLAVIRHRSIRAFLSTMADVGPRHSPEEQVLGLIALGLVLVSFFAAVRIFQNNHNGKNK